MPGKDHTDYYYVRFSAYAELNGERIDIAGLLVDYALNQIPTASIYPTVGREPENNKEAKAVDKLLAAQPFTPIKIFAKFETDKDNPSDDPGFPIDEDVLLFDGYITGVVYQTSRNPAGGWVSLVAGAMGWLAGLRGTSAQTAKSTVKGPGGFAELANLNNGKSSIFNVKQAFAAGVSGIPIDLWKEFIKPFFNEITKTKSVWGDSPNTSAVSALKRMDKPDFSGAAAMLPFQFGENADDINIVGEFFGQDIGNHIFKLWRRANLWDALLSIGQDFGFSVVPLIDTASCVAVYPALNGEAHRYITTNDYNKISLDVKTSMKIVKVVVAGTISSSPFSPTPITSVIVGMHSAEAAWADPALGTFGQTLVLPAPPWLTAMTPIGTITRDSVGSDKLLIPDATNPTANVKAPETNYQEFFNRYLTSDLGDRYAQTLAQALLFADRSGTLTGRFRLDISPGSLVKVQVIDDKFSEERASEKAVFGMVHAVKLELNAGRDGAVGMASTQFNLKFIRTAQEHELAGTALTSPVHPLYNTRFTGVKLWSK